MRGILDMRSVHRTSASCTSGKAATTGRRPWQLFRGRMPLVGMELLGSIAALHSFVIVGNRDEPTQVCPCMPTGLEI